MKLVRFVATGVMWASSLAPVGLWGQGSANAVPAQRPGSQPRTVEAAEAEGATYPTASELTEQSGYAEASGPKERKCVDADAAKHVAARSGEFVAGPFDRRVMFGSPTSPESAKRKVWWTPRQTAVMPPMQLRAAKIGSPDLTASWTFPSVVSNESGFFFNTLVRFPQAGKWLVVVTSGNNWGCFILDEVF
jgi:hypothetical protein